jgi:hypothetical protein
VLDCAANRAPECIALRFVKPGLKDGAKAHARKNRNAIQSHRVGLGSKNGINMVLRVPLDLFVHLGGVLVLANNSNQTMHFSAEFWDIRKEIRKVLEALQQIHIVRKVQLTHLLF